MKTILPFLTLMLLSSKIWGQIYERKAICKNDTISVDYFSHKLNERLQSKAFECQKVSKLGIRFDIGFNHYKYNSKTRAWLGNHNGPLWGLAIAYGDFNIGAKFKPATIVPKEDLIFNGETLNSDAKLNPIKIDYDISYSINFKYNFSIEPYISLTANSFFVINEDELNKKYNINKVHGLTIGTAINKYFHIKDFQFFSFFVKYAYGFTNFKKVNSNLGIGYSDIVIGIAYKGFINQKILKRI